jgi:hypothetical protein
VIRRTTRKNRLKPGSFLTPDTKKTAALMTADTGVTWEQYPVRNPREYKSIGRLPDMVRRPIFNSVSMSSKRPEARTLMKQNKRRLAESYGIINP